MHQNLLCRIYSLVDKLVDKLWITPNKVPRCGWLHVLRACGSSRIPTLSFITRSQSTLKPLSFQSIPGQSTFYCLFVCLLGFLTSSSTTRLYRGRAPRQSVWQFYVLPHMRQTWETMTSISAGHIILTPTQLLGSGRPQRGSNPGPPDQESRALPTELPRPHILLQYE